MSELVSITPAKATELLDHGGPQRTLSKGTVKRYALDMATGRWWSELCPPILLGPNNEVVDGQHRLAATALVGKNDPEFVLRSFVEHAASLEAIHVIDTGKPRNVADTLSILGYKNTRHMSAMWNTSRLWALGGMRAVSRSRIVEWIQSNPDAQASASFAYAHMQTGRERLMAHVPSGPIATLHNISIHGLGPDSVEEFIQDVLCGRLAGENDVVRRFIKQVENSRRKTTRSGMTVYQLGYLTARLYTNWVDDVWPNLYARRTDVEQVPGYTEWYDKYWSSWVGS